MTFPILQKTLDAIKAKSDGSYAVVMSQAFDVDTVAAATAELAARDGAPPLRIDVDDIADKDIPAAMDKALASGRSVLVKGFGQVGDDGRQAVARGLEKISEAGRSAVALFVNSQDGSLFGVGALDQSKFPKALAVGTVVYQQSENVSMKVKQQREERGVPSFAPQAPAAQKPV